MPHDRNGFLLNPGDLVYIPAVVQSVAETQDGLYCNVTMQTKHPMPPYESGTTIVLNGKQVERVTVSLDDFDGMELTGAVDVPQHLVDAVGEAVK